MSEEMSMSHPGGAPVDACPAWCAGQHEASQEHQSSIVVLAELEDGQGFFAARLEGPVVEGTGAARVRIMAMSSSWSSALPLAVVERVAAAVDDDGNRALQALGALLSQAHRGAF